MSPLFKGSPADQPEDIIGWAEEFVRLIGSVRSERYDRNITPWTIAPIRCQADDVTRRTTLVKPVQSGGSRVGLIALCWWARYGYGQIQYNWEKDEKAEAKWENETEPTLIACKALEWAQAAVKCYAKFRRAFIRSQGVWIPENLDSDSVPYQCNEEIHSWKPGHLAKARGRQTAVSNPKALDISNAGMKGDQLYNAFEEGTMEFWQVKCPGCGIYHQMRTRWEDRHPELGGLRYDTEGCKLPGGKFNYNKLEPTIRFQMPCGYIVRDNPIERRALSLSGRYSEPSNPGAHISHRSFTYEAVSVDFIPWMLLIQEKHAALRARAAGNNVDWLKYITERECLFFSDDQIPFQGSIVINSKVKKNREGMPGKKYRSWSADWQRGYKHLSQLSHYWLIIEDTDENCNSQIVFEGQVQTSSELVGTLDEHKCPRWGGFVDASNETKAILEMCYRNGLNAVMANASHKGSFLHKKDAVRRFYSEDRPIHKELNMPSRFDYVPSKEGWVPNPEEPVIIDYNKAGLIANHFFIRDHKANVTASLAAQVPPRIPDASEYIERVIPGDVSEEFKLQNESWERVSLNQKKDNDDVEGFQKIRKADHLFMCLCYQDLFKEWIGLLGPRLATLGVRISTEGK